MRYRNFVPIVIINNISILVYCKKRLCIYNYAEDSLVTIVALPSSMMEKLYMTTNCFRRLFRLVNIVGTAVNENEYIIVFKSKVYRLLIDKKELFFLYALDNGTRPLSLIKISNEDFMDDGVYYGDYCGNPLKKEMNIYQIDSNYNKNIVYTFANGEINHIHSLILDKYNKCVWIFTGDFGNGAAIWMAKNNFLDVVPIMRGNQSYRSCVASCYNGDLYYMTDTPFEHNSLRKLCKENGEWISKFFCDINGSVIYGMEINDNLIFSSTVEANGVCRSMFTRYTSRKKGDGIVDYYSYLYCFNKDTQVLSIKYKQKKDFLPFALFQFGTFIFPSGTWNKNVVPLFQIATKKNDLKTAFIDLNDE